MQRQGHARRSAARSRAQVNGARLFDIATTPSRGVGTDTEIDVLEIQKIGLVETLHGFENIAAHEHDRAHHLPDISTHAMCGERQVRKAGIGHDQVPADRAPDQTGDCRQSRTRRRHRALAVDEFRAGNADTFRQGSQAGS